MISPLGQWTTCGIANMDQTPLPFTFSDEDTHADTGERSVCVHGSQSSLEKRQCTVQLTVFAYYEPSVKPLIILKRKGHALR